LASLRAEAKSLREDNLLLVERDQRLRHALRAAAEAQERAEAQGEEAAGRARELEADLQGALVALLRAQNKRAEEIAAHSEAKALGSASILEELRQVQRQLEESQQATAAADSAPKEAAATQELRRANADLRRQLALREKEARQLRVKLKELSGVDVYSGTLARLVGSAKSAGGD
jgi:hypothetical protein